MNIKTLATNFGIDVEGTSSDKWAETSNLDWNINARPMYYSQENDLDVMVEGKKALVNSNTGSLLGIVSDRYNIVQPETMLETFSYVVDLYGFKMDRLGSYGDGKVIWGRANMHDGFSIGANDEINYYMYFVTSADGSAATHAFVSTLRVACMNALNFASKHSAIYSYTRHSSEYDPESFKISLSGLDIAKKEFQEDIQMLSEIPVGEDKAFTKAFCSIFGYAPIEEGRKQTLWLNKHAEIKRLMYNSPGAELGKYANSYWNFLNAITYDIDHNNSARSNENAHKHVIMRTGAKKKEQAFEKVIELAKAA